MKFKTIRISEDTDRRLKSLGVFGNSYNYLINKVLDMAGIDDQLPLPKKP